MNKMSFRTTKGWRQVAAASAILLTATSCVSPASAEDQKIFTPRTEAKLGNCNIALNGPNEGVYILDNVTPEIDACTYTELITPCEELGLEQEGDPRLIVQNRDGEEFRIILESTCRDVRGNRLSHQYSEEVELESFDQR